MGRCYGSVACRVAPSRDYPVAVTTPHEEQPDQAEQVLGEVAGDYSDLDPGTRPTDEEHPLWVLLGGPWGAVESMAPTVLFAATYLVSGDDLGVAVVVALVAAAVLALVRVWRKERPVRVLSGLVGVTVAALFAAWRGSPEAFFTIRVLANVLSALAFAISIFIRRPLLGIIVGPIMGTGMRWRKIGRAHV